MRLSLNLLLLIAIVAILIITVPKVWLIAVGALKVWQFCLVIVALYLGLDLIGKNIK